MAGEWIRVRAALRKDPRVRAMADYLAEQRAFMDWMTDPVRRTCGVTVYEHVTRDVTVRITVCALVDLWSAANEAGKGDGDDLVMVHCTIDALDTMADLPCFGEAMASVDWAVQEEDERGRPVVRLPKFLIHNTPADERKPSAAAERQRRYRQRQAEQGKERDVTRDAQRNVTRDVTVTPREEKRREEEKKIDPPAAAPSPVKKAKKAKTPLQDDFSVSDAVKAWAGKAGYDRLDEHLDAFKRKAAANGYAYVNWDAAFMEAVREDWAKLRTTRNGSPAPVGHTVPSRAADETARYLAERAEQEKQSTLPPAALLAKVRGAIKETA